MSWRQRAQVSDGQLRPAAARTVWCMQHGSRTWLEIALRRSHSREGGEDLYGSFADAVAHNTLVAADTHTFSFRCFAFGKSVSGLSGRRCARFNYNVCLLCVRTSTTV